jgi:hypothetical protein
MALRHLAPRRVGALRLETPHPPIHCVGYCFFLAENVYLIDTGSDYVSLLVFGSLRARVSGRLRPNISSRTTPGPVKCQPFHNSQSRENRPNEESKCSRRLCSLAVRSVTAVVADEDRDGDGACEPEDRGDEEEAEGDHAVVEAGSEAGC